MRLNPNMFSLNIYNNFKGSLVDNSKSMNNISSGIKLNKAKDNPNKIAQSQSLKIQVLSNAAANRNIQDTNSMIQTFDGAMQEMNNSLGRLKELTVKSGDGTLSDGDKQALQGEINQLINHIDYMAENTEFNGNKLLNTDGEIKATIGSMKDENTNIPKYDLTAKNLKIEGMDITNRNNVDKAIQDVDNAIDKVSSARSKYGALQSKLEDSGNNLEQNNISLEKSQSNIMDADLAEEMLKFSQSQILMQSSMALMSQSNNFPQDALRILQNVK